MNGSNKDNDCLQMNPISCPVVSLTSRIPLVWFVIHNESTKICWLALPELTEQKSASWGIGMGSGEQSKAQRCSSVWGKVQTAGLLED